MKQRKKRILLPLLALAIAGALTLLAGLGVLKGPDLAASDALYQRRTASDGQIVLVGIDQRALEELGPYSQWGRGILARAVETLNAEEDCRPAVIGLDILFVGETDPEADAQLVQAAGRYGNVITACAAEFGTGLVEYRDDYRLAEHQVLSFDQPFEALRQVTGQGHINAMLDSDGILRHHLLAFSLPDGTQTPSLALAVADRYRAVCGGGPVDRPPTDARGFWYLPFCGTPGDLSQSISVADLLSGGVDPARFAGKIVLIGPYAAGLQDSYVTAADHTRLMYGVEYQANAVQALLWGDHKTEAGNGVQLAVMFVFLLLALACFWRRPVKWATAFWAVLCGGWILLCLGAYRTGWVSHVLWVPAGITILYAGCLAANYIQSALERQQVTRTFQRYVAPEIVSELMNAGPAALKLGGNKCDIAVLFVDIRDFTTMSESLEPERVVEILNQYLTLTTKCVMDNHGTLDKFVGDCTMAFWNAPLPQDDYVMLACRTAMAMSEGAKPLAEMLQKEYGNTVSFGIGVHMGPAVVGNIGAPMRMDYTAIGDTVNTAARLEASAPAGTIYISRAVADAMAGRIKATPLKEPPRLKGKAAGFEILTLDAILYAAHFTEHLPERISAKWPVAAGGSSAYSLSCSTSSFA